MKRSTRKAVMTKAAHSTYTSERSIYTDILDSDAKQRAEIRDLKARLEAALALAGKHICPHEERHRGGVIWEFCDNCDAKWADDEGGFKPNPDAALLEAIADTKNWRKP